MNGSVRTIKIINQKISQLKDVQCVSLLFKKKKKTAESKEKHARTRVFDN